MLKVCNCRPRPWRRCWLTVTSNRGRQMDGNRRVRNLRLDTEIILKRLEYGSSCSGLDHKAGPFINFPTLWEHADLGQLLYCRPPVSAVRHYQSRVLAEPHLADSGEASAFVCDSAAAAVQPCHLDCNLGRKTLHSN